MLLIVVDELEPTKRSAPGAHPPVRAPLQIALAVPAGALQFVGFEFCKEKLEKLLPDSVSRFG